MFKYFRDIRKLLEHLVTHSYNRNVLLSEIARKIDSTNLDAPRFHEKFNARNIPAEDEAGRDYSAFERLCIAFDRFDAATFVKKQKDNKDKTAAEK